MADAAGAGAAGEKTDRPIRVSEGEVVVGRCPLCTKPLLAQVEVEVRLGPLTIGRTVDEETGEIPVEVSAQPRLRKLKIEHECQAKPVGARVRKPRTPRAVPVVETPPIPIETPTDDDDEAQRAADEAHEKPFREDNINA